MSLAMCWASAKPGNRRDVRVRPRSERGIRIFADYLPQEHLADPLLRRRLWHLELAAAGKLPHRRIARYLHMLAIKL